MNTYAVVTLAGLLTALLVETAAEGLNASRLVPELPREMKGVFDPVTYARSQSYARAGALLAIARKSGGLLLLMAFWHAGGFGWAAGLAREAGSGVTVQGLAFFGLLLLLRTAAALPFAAWETFVVEERYGFNRTTARTFAFDLAKGLALAAALGAPLLAAVVALFHRAGEAAWIWCWLAVTAYMAFVHFAAPAWIMPLFNRFEPLGEGELRRRIFAFARSVDFPLENVFVMDGSRRTTKSNAFFTGFGRHRRIALFDTLLEKQTVSELVAVIAHEVGHCKRGHVLKAAAVSAAHAGLLLFLVSLLLLRPGLYEAFGVEGTPVYAGLLLAGLVISPLDLVLSPLAAALSRRQEREADRFAAAATGDPDSLAAALKKLAVNNLANLTPHPLYVLLHYSHPPLLERVARLEGREP